ncbi:MAG: SCO family protein [Halofilum sp. (in: g-proteobacteria)]
MTLIRLMTRWFPLRVVGLALTLTMVLSACGSEPEWDLRDVSGLLPDLDYELERAADGATVTEDAYAGEVRVLFFGFTNCPDICPMTLQKFSQAVRSLEGGADEVRVLFVSVDPERDDREKLREYVSAFGDRFVGLRGPEPVLRDLAKRYRVTFGYGEPDEAGYYDVSHSSAAYIFDREGNIRLLARQDSSIGEIERDLQRLVGQ